MKRVMLVFGTRPEAIKMAPLVLAMQQRPDEFECITCVTGQHRQMLDQVLDLFGIKPDFDLNIMHPGQTLSDVTVAVLTGVGRVLRSSRPDIVLVQGDTTTCLSAALSAFYERIPVGHVEAGLRTHEKYSPYPEEINRQLTTRLADYHFAPTDRNRQNLLDEGISPDKIFVTGNTVIDALCVVRNRIYSSASVRERLDEMLGRVGLIMDGRRRILVTGHRRESFGEGFLNICEALRRIAQRHPSIEIVYPVHLNPNVLEPVKRILGGIANIRLLAPLDYEPFVYLMNESHIILTDSGGVQEEGPSLGKPVLVMRTNTERPEAVTAGTVLLLGVHADRIFSGVCELLEDATRYDQMCRATNPYGDGHSSKRILDLVSESVAR